MARNIRKYNHTKRIVGKQPANIKAIYPGMICEFKYAKANVTDGSPLILVIWNDYEGYKIHGVNLNYLPDLTVRQIFQELSERDEGVADDLPVTTEDQEEGQYDDELPNRNLLKKPFTRIKLPTYKEKQDGKKVSKSQAEVQMKRIYDRVLKKYIKQYQVYRSYSYKMIQTPSVVFYDAQGMVK
tara:strand:+ start:2266 stop:2817 length:552 start_codon:yes stop_codon:yes gene_type:complete